jgi:hypothetical protein
MFFFFPFYWLGTGVPPSAGYQIKNSYYRTLVTAPKIFFTNKVISYESYLFASQQTSSLLDTAHAYVSHVC